MGGSDHPCHPLRMTDGGFPSTHPCPSSVEEGEKKTFWPTRWRCKEGQSVRTFPPRGPRKSTWTCGGGRHAGVNLDCQRRAVNFGSSSNGPTGECEESNPPSGWVEGDPPSVIISFRFTSLHSGPIRPVTDGLRETPHQSS